MLRVTSALLLLVGFVLAWPQVGQAQSFSFSIGGYPHCHGHHHHCWGSPYWYGPHVDYVYLYPPPRPRVTYVQPVQPYQARVEPTIPYAASSTPAAGLSQPPASQTLQIWNSAAQRSSVAFLANSQNMTLADGQSHTFYGGGTRTIEFDRGGSYGTARYELASGQHEFVLTSRGWDLVPKSDRPAPIALQPIVPKNSLPAVR
jgi:hypothetical protein